MLQYRKPTPASSGRLASVRKFRSTGVIADVQLVMYDTNLCRLTKWDLQFSNNSSLFQSGSLVFKTGMHCAENLIELAMKGRKTQATFREGLIQLSRFHSNARTTLL